MARRLRSTSLNRQKNIGKDRLTGAGEGEKVEEEELEEEEEEEEEVNGNETTTMKRR